LNKEDDKNIYKLHYEEIFMSCRCCSFEKLAYPAINSSAHLQ